MIPKFIRAWQERIKVARLAKAEQQRASLKRRAVIRAVEAHMRSHDPDRTDKIIWLPHKEWDCGEFVVAHSRHHRSDLVQVKLGDLEVAGWVQSHHLPGKNDVMVNLKHADAIIEAAT